MSRFRCCLLSFIMLMIGLGRPAWSQPPAGQAGPGTPPPGAQNSAGSDLHGDALPAGARARIGTLRLCHGGAISCLVFSPDGKTLASAGEDPIVRLWDVASGREIRQLQGHEGPVRSIAFLPDGSALISTGDDRTVRIWDVITGQELRQWTGPENVFPCLALSPDGRTLALPGSDNKICLWDVQTGKETRQFKGPQGLWLRHLAFSPDGRSLVSAGMQDGYVLWDVATGKRLRRFEMANRGFDGSALNTAFSPDGRHLAAGIIGALQLWEVGSMEAVRQFGEQGMPIFCVAFAPDGKTLVSAGMDGDVRIWEVESGKELRRLPGDRHQVDAMAFSPDGKTLATGNQSGRIRLWDPATGKERVAAGWAASPQAFDAIAFSAEKAIPGGPGEALLTVDAQAIHHWDPGTGKDLHRLDLPHAAAGNLPTVALAPDGHTLALARRDQGLAFLDARTGKELRKIERHGEGMLCLAFSPDSRLLATVEMEPALQIRIWDVAGPATAKELRLLKVARALPAALAFSPDSKTLIGLEHDGAVQQWEIASGKPRRRFGGTVGQPISTDPDDNMMRFMVMQRQAMRRQWVMAGGGGGFMPGGAPEPDSSVAGPAFSPDGRLLATCRSQAIQLRDLVTGKIVRALGGHENQVTAVSFSPDGKLLASGGRDKTVRLWDPATGRQLCELHGHRGSIHRLTFSADSKTLVSASADATALVWDVAAAIATGRDKQPETLSAEKRAALWANLASPDASRAGAALADLEARPDVAVALLAERLRPVPATDPQQISRMLGQLDSKRFAVREKATQQLEQLGERARPALRKALAAGPALEVRQRIEQLLEKLSKPVASTDLLRELRAIEILEQVGTAPARQVLESLARGDSEGRLTRDARDALARLAARNRVGP